MNKKFTLALTVFALIAIASMASAGDRPPQLGTDGPGGTYVPANNRDDVAIWCQQPAFAGGTSSQEDNAYPFESWVADDFVSPGDEAVQSVQWWGTYFNVTEPADPSEFIISFFGHDGSCDPGVPPTLLYEYYSPDYTIADMGNGYFEYNADIPPFLTDAGSTYWISIQAVLEFTPNGQWGWDATATETACPSVNLFPLLGIEVWTPVGTDAAFCLYFDGDNPVATEESSWDGVKSLYR